MNWIKLINCDKDSFPHGTVFRLTVKYPYENVIDFMVFEPSQESKGQGLMVSSGYKAGLILILLPKESGKLAIEKEWLINNWSHWVYPECDVSDVFVSDGYVAISALPCSLLAFTGCA